MAEKGIIESLCIVAGGVASALLIYEWLNAKAKKPTPVVLSSVEATATKAPANGFEQLFAAPLQTVVAS